jgi:hypothetical protein
LGEWLDESSERLDGDAIFPEFSSVPVKVLPHFIVQIIVQSFLQPMHTESHNQQCIGKLGVQDGINDPFCSAA